VALLPGWETSQGAAVEVALAKLLGLKFLDAITLEPYKFNGEVRVTDPETGAQKCSKPERFDLIPVESLEELARVYAYGSSKYADHNWCRGYRWGLSFAAMMRHAWAFWRGEDLDQESGLPHMAHAAWHCFTLIWFTNHMPNKDDRYKP
jgi:hypothetical protein